MTQHSSKKMINANSKSHKEETKKPYSDKAFKDHRVQVIIHIKVMGNWQKDHSLLFFKRLVC